MQVHSYTHGSFHIVIPCSFDGIYVIFPCFYGLQGFQQYACITLHTLSNQQGQWFRRTISRYYAQTRTSRHTHKHKHIHMSSGTNISRWGEGNEMWKKTTYGLCGNALQVKCKNYMFIIKRAVNVPQQHRKSENKCGFQFHIHWCHLRVNSTLE